MSDLVLSVPRPLRRGYLKNNERESVDSGLELIRLICRTLGVDDLGDLSVLDMGCGSKLVQAILQENLPIGHYAGIDVFPDMISFLTENVPDPRFEFHVLDAHNEMYNPEGLPVSASTQLPLAPASADLICLFSVFTHLAPQDYMAMLQMLRKYVKPQGKLIFSLFVNEETPGGMGFIDAWVRAWKQADESVVDKFGGAFVDESGDGAPPDFVDYYPDQPLKCAMYSRPYALKLVQGTGWKVESLNDPESSIQHFMVCTPQ